MVRRSLVDQREALRRQREFAADASHELRTPLTVIRASVDDLQRHPADPVGSVGSALTDIGLTALFSRTLADAGISCNVIAGLAHDHLFVGWEQGEQARALLAGL